MFSSLYTSLEVLRNVSKTIATATTEQELFGSICRVFVEIGGYRMCWIGRAEHDENKTVQPIASYGFEDGYLETLGITWADSARGQGPTGTAIRTRGPVSCQNITEAVEFSLWRTEAQQRSYASVVAIPIILDGVVFGTINIYSSKPDDFDMKQSDFFAELMNDLAQGITNVRQRISQEQEMMTNESRKLRALQARTSINLLLKSAVTKMSMEKQLGVALDILLKLPWIAVEKRGVVFLYNAGNQTLEMVTHRNIHPILIEKCKSVPLGHCLCGRSAAAKSMLFFPHIDHHHEITYAGIAPHGHYCIPILSQGDLLGLITLYVKNGYHPDKNEEDFFITIANTLANLIEFRRVEHLIEDEKNFSKAILDVTTTLVLVIDTNGRIITFNKSCQATTAYTEAEVIGAEVWDFLLPEEQIAAVKGVFAALSIENQTNSHESLLVAKDGTMRLIEWSNRFIEWYKESTHERFRSQFILCTGIDVTEKRLADAQLRHIATHDPLTGLPNRLLFRDLIKRRAKINATFSVMFIDLDGFKTINDSHGHDAGDLVLIEIGRRIQSHLRSNDVVARMGGDEFTVIFDTVIEDSAIAIVADRMIRSIAAPISDGEKSYQVSASIGISLFPHHSDDPDKIISLADAAMYRVKKSGKNGFSVYDGCVNKSL